MLAIVGKELRGMIAVEVEEERGMVGVVGMVRRMAKEDKERKALEEMVKVGVGLVDEVKEERVTMGVFGQERSRSLVVLVLRII